jgi:hypothetical protein
MDVQLKEAAANGDKLVFNGDETEICGAVDLTAVGAPDNIQAHTWSLSSVAMAAAALDFYRDYVRLRGDDPAHYHNAQDNTTVDLNQRLKDLVAAMDRDFWRTDVPAAPGGFHDSFRVKSDGSWPKNRLANFTLMPVFFSTPYAADEKAKDVAVIAPMFDPKNQVLPLVPGSGAEGHDLGYLLWGMVETGDWRKDQVYRALVDGPTVDCWGSTRPTRARDQWEIALRGGGGAFRSRCFTHSVILRLRLLRSAKIKNSISRFARAVSKDQPPVIHTALKRFRSPGADPSTSSG